MPDAVFHSPSPSFIVTVFSVNLTLSLTASVPGL